MKVNFRKNSFILIGAVLLISTIITTMFLTAQGAGAESVDFTISLKEGKYSASEPVDIKPGDDKVLTLNLDNKEKKATDVYISVKSKKELPVTFSVKDSTSVEDSYKVSLPAAATNSVDLSLKWDISENDYKYNAEVDYMYIFVSTDATLADGEAVKLAKATDLYAVKAHQFYFGTDKFTETGSSFSTAIGGKVPHFDFDVNNYYDSKRITDCDIDYKIEWTVNGNADVSMTHKAANSDEEEYTNGTQLTLSQSGSDKVTENFRLTVDADYDANAEINMVISSTAPYKKVIEFDIKLAEYSKSDYNYYYIKDNKDDPYAELVIEAGDKGIKAEELQISWDTAKYTIDCTNSYLLQDGAITTGVDSGSFRITKDIVPDASISFYLFKKDITKNYSTEEQMITDNSVTVN